MLGEKGERQMREIEKCFLCGEDVFWYDHEEHLDKHYEMGDFADRETESRLEKGRASK